MTKEELKQYIDQNIYENVDGDISGDSLNEILKAIVDDGGTKVEANPTGEATTPLNKIKIGETNYNIPQTDTSNLVTEQELAEELGGYVRKTDPPSPAADNLVAFNEYGGFGDSGKKVTDFATRAQGEKAETAVQPAALETLATKQELQQGLAGKQDTISDLEQIRTRADEGHTALQPRSTGQYTENNFVSFDTNGGIKDSGCNENTFIKGVKQNGTLITPVSGVVDVTVQDGKSALQIYNETYGTNLNEAQFIDVLKQNYPMEYVAYNQTAAEQTIGTGFQAIDSLTADSTTAGKMYLMPNDGTTPTGTILFVTVQTGTSTYAWYKLGDLDVPSNVLTDGRIVNDLTTGGVDDVASAETVKTIADTTMELVESLNILDPSTITLNRYVRGGTGGQGDVSSSSSSYVYGCTDFIVIGDGVICNHSTASHGTSVCSGCVYDSSKKYIGYIATAADGNSKVVDSNTTISGTPESGADVTDKHYVRFNLYNPSTPYDGINDGYAVYRGITLPSAFQSWIEPYWKQKDTVIQDGAITTAKIADAAVTIDKVFDVVEEYASDNILNSDTCVFETGKYINLINGTIGSSSSPTTKANGYTDYLPIDSRGIVFNHGLRSGTNIGAAVYYLDGQGNKVFKRGNIGYNNGKDQVIAVNYDAGDKSLPDSDPGHYPDAFVRFTISNAGAANNVMCNIGTVLKDYVPYGGIKKILSPEILPKNETDIYNILQQEKIYTDALKVALPDKFYAVRGDILQLFHKGVVYAIDFANRYAMPTCSKGAQYRRYYELNTTKVVFVVASSVNITVGDVYSTQGNTYEVTKVATEGSTKSVTCNFKGSATITSSGTLTKVSGSGDASVAYTKFTDTVAAGEYPYTLTIYDDNRNILGEGSSIIKLVNFPTAPQSTKRILCIGASTTAGGQWVCEAQRRLLGSGVNPTYTNSPQGDGLDATKIKFIGSISKTLYGQSASFFAKSGWGWEDYATAGRYAIRFYLEGTNRVTIGTKYTNNGHTYEVIELNTIDGVETIRCSTASGNTPSPHGDNVNGTLTLSSGDGDATLTYIKSEVDGANPFWNGTLETPALDFQNYIENTCGETGIDMMIIVLGANAMFSTALEQQKEYVRTFVEACHTDYPDCKIILVGSSSPSMINMLPGYGVGGSSFGNTYLVKCRLLDIFEMYKAIAADYEYVEFESWSGQFDSDYNFPLSQKAVNTRNDSVTEPFANNTLHPSDAGYMQFADAAYRSIVAHLCQ